MWATAGQRVFVWDLRGLCAEWMQTRFKNLILHRVSPLIIWSDIFHKRCTRFLLSIESENLEEGKKERETPLKSVHYKPQEELFLYRSLARVGKNSTSRLFSDALCVSVSLPDRVAPPRPFDIILFFESFVVKPPKWRVWLQRGVLLVSGDPSAEIRYVFAPIVVIRVIWHFVVFAVLLRREEEEEVEVRLSTIPRLPATGTNHFTSFKRSTSSGCKGWRSWARGSRNESRTTPLIFL